MGVKKYFIAIVLPSPWQEQVEGLKQALFEAYGLKGALRSPAHITLHRPFEWKEEKEPELIRELSAFRFEKPFSISLRDFGFFEPRVVFVDVQKSELLFELHRQLTFFAARQLKLFNERDDERGFHPHATIAFRDLKKPLFYELKQAFENKTLQGQFDYTGFTLLRLEERWQHCAFFPARGI